MNEFNGKNVLIAEGRARQSLPLIRYFKKHGLRVSVLCYSVLDVSYSSRYPDEKILGECNNEKPEETYLYIKSLIETGKYDLVVPTTDFIAELLSKHKEEFSKFTNVAVVDWNVFQLAIDKQKTMKVCMENNIPCPYTLQNIDKIDKIIDSNISFPIVVKPKVGYGAIGFHRFDNFSELSEFISDRQKTDNNFFLYDYVFQEYIPQTDIQYECAMFIGENDEVKTSVVFSKNRWYPITGGSSTLNITVKKDDIVENCYRLLKAIHWRGACDIDLIQDPRDGVAKIMEINPRVSGSVRICFDAGADQSLQMAEYAFGKEITEYNNYEVGRRLRCSQTDFLWFIKSKDRLRCKPSWFSNYKTNDQIFYFDDPLPWITFSISGLLRYSNEMRKRKQ